MAAIALTVNRVSHTVDVDPPRPLLYVLATISGSVDRSSDAARAVLGLTVIVGPAVRIVHDTGGSVGGAEITTLEGLGTADRPLQSRKRSSTNRRHSAGSASTGHPDREGVLDQNPKRQTRRSGNRCRRCCAMLCARRMLVAISATRRECNVTPVSNRRARARRIVRRDFLRSLARS